ncbi:MAG TPA: aspartate aminotransferase [Lentisphaeria bacterium]|nr:aspartate aminotransferase [Lentisphaeria bacterium]
MTEWFDRAPSRQHTGSLKWAKYQGRDILPLWVADMDFQPPPQIVSALERWALDGVPGYCVATSGLRDVMVAALKERYAWEIDGDALVWLPGLVPALNVVTRISGELNSGAISNVPIYPPFLTAPGNAGRTLVRNPLAIEEGRYALDLSEIREACSAFMFCNPQNPTGRVFTRPELEQVAELCLERDLLLCSDEIHCDLLLDDVQHLPIASLSAEIADRTITLMAPSKTYNVPGLCCAFAVIPNRALRRKFVRSGRGLLAEVSAPGFVACEVAYRDCEEWRQALLAYLRVNRQLVVDAVSAMPGVRYLPGEATYLAWLDCRGAGMEYPHAFFERAGVGLSDGKDFGQPGFVRLNFGCRKALLEQALARMVAAMKEVG